MSGSLVELHGGRAAVVNTTGIETESVAKALNDQGLKPLADALNMWAEKVQHRPNKRRISGMFDRNRWLSPESPLEKIRMARESLRDDVIGAAADGTEALVLSKVSFSCDEEDEEDVWNQIAGDLNLDDQLRKAWRIDFSESQFAAAVWYDTRSYKVRGNRSKAKARKEYNDLTVPVGMTFLDTTKIIPVGNLMFGQERLAYQASPLEAIRIDTILAKRDGIEPPDLPRSVRVNGTNRRTSLLQKKAVDELLMEDPLIEQIVMGRHFPDWVEAQELADDGVDYTNLFLLNPTNVFRHTLTKPDYMRFADVRLESVFELLDIKSQLRQMDRTHLLSGANFIILITKGSDQLPAEQTEIDGLRSQVSAFAVATIPVIIGDHRLNVEIITPKLDMILAREKWDTIDVRIQARVWQTLIPTGADRSDPLKLAKVIAKGLESRRHMLRRTFEREIIDRTRLMNQTQLTSRATLRFSPASIALDFDPAWASFILDLRSTNDISRETALSQFDISQKEEAARRTREKKQYDNIFQTQEPHGTPNPANANADPQADPNADPGLARAEQRAAGRRARGGGAAPGSGQGQEPINPRRVANKDNPKRKSVDTAGKLKLYMLAQDLQIPGRSGMTKEQLREAVRTTMTHGGITEDDLDWENDE